MLTRFSVARCCCRCIPCPSCWGGLAPEVYWLHITQGAFTGNYQLTPSGGPNSCTWQGSSGTKTATLDISGSPPSIQVSDTAQPGLLARWQWTGGIGEVDCLWKGDDGGAWTCQTGTGLADCTGAQIEVKGVRLSRVNAVTDGQLERITDQDGDRITGVIEEDCGAVSGNDCDKCAGNAASVFYDVIAAGFVDVVSGDGQSKFNGTWKIARQAGPGSCIYGLPPLFETPQIDFIFDGTAGGPTYAWFDMILQVFPNQFIYRWRYPHATNNVTGNLDCINFGDPGAAWVCIGANPGQSCANQPGATITVRPSGSAGAMAAAIDPAAPSICPRCDRLSLRRYWGCKKDKTLIERCSCGFKRIGPYHGN